jgi:photosystem II stability/assembly factor-like uncharacterized protein
MTSEILRTPLSRVFVIEDGAGPASTPEYLGFARAQGAAQSLGDITPIRQPSVDQYDRFTVIDRIKGQPDLPTLTIENRYQPVLSTLLRIARTGCAVDIHVHFGRCQNPEDFDGGWDKILILESAEPTNWETTELGAMDADQDATIEETEDFSGLDLYEVKQLLASELAASEIVASVVDVAICDAVSCGECGIPSKGCDIVFFLTSETAGSPGLGVEIVFTEDGGSTFSQTTITTIDAGENATAIACVGTNLVVISKDSNSLHYAPIVDVLAGTETWTEVTTGFEVGGEPNAIFSLGATATWIVGDGGHIYFSTDITSGVTVQSSGAVSAENLLSIHGIGRNNLAVVGETNAVLFTEDGGTTWALAPSGPAVGIDLNAVFQRSTLEWLIGDAGGQLWFTRNAGVDWTEKTFPGSGAGEITDIAYATRNVGYIAHNTAVPAGRILRTTNGGSTWVVMPEKAGQVIPANAGLNAIAACKDDVNVVFGGGDASALDDGFAVKFA